MRNDESDILSVSRFSTLLRTLIFSTPLIIAFDVNWFIRQTIVYYTQCLDPLEDPAAATFPTCLLS